MKFRLISKLRAALFVTVACLAGNNAAQAAGCAGDDLRLSEICFLPLPGQAQWVEIVNTGSPFAAGGVEIVSNNRSYSLPSELSLIPSNGIVVVYFDGAGPGGNDYSFAGDNKAVLHSPPGATNALGSPVGFCSLYRVTGAHSKETLLDFVAWGGAPGEAASEAVEKGIWSGTKVHLWTDADDPPLGPGGWGLQAGDSIGRDNAGGWKHIPASKSVKGLAILSTPNPIFPNEGMAILNSPARCTFKAVAGATKYEVQIASNAEFTEDLRALDASDPIVGAQIEPALPKHKKYWWRVRAIGPKGETSEWCSPIGFTVGQPPPPPRTAPKPASSTKSGYTVRGTITDAGVTEPGANTALPGATVTIDGKSDVTDAFGDFAIAGVNPGTHSVNVSRDHYTFPSPPSTVSVVDSDVSGVTVAGTGEQKLLGVVALAARKDTTMLATKPGSTVPDGETSRWMCNRNNSDNQAWDRPLPRPTHRGRDLESWWCWAVGATMINHFYGGTITRDEVVNHIKDGLLHDSDAGASVWECLNALCYVMSLPELSVLAVGIDAGDPFSAFKPSDAKIKEWLDAGRPIYSSQPGHIMVLRAYKYQNGDFYVEHVNTDNNGDTEFRRWSDVELAGNALVGVICWCPKTGLTARAGDARVAADSDGDGVCDFDEQERFQPGKEFPHTFLAWGGVGLNSGSPDSDNDGIADKIEIASYMFPTNILNGGAISTGKWPPKDPDNDKRYPPVDDDSDNGGVKDGDEDVNHNGIRDAGENDIFDKNDDGSLDLVFCIDNTGSMSDDIAAVKAQAINIVNDTASKFKDFRIAVVGYRDFSVEPYGDPGDYVTRDFLGFSTNKSAIIAAINSMGADGGNDWDEAVYSAIMHCINGSTLGGWRKPPVQRKILVMGDAPPHDPEPFTGYTLASVTAAASAGGVVWEKPYTGSSTKGDDKELSGPISAITILIGSDSGALASFTDIARETDGTLIRAATAGHVPAAVLEALERIKTDPIAILELSGNYRDTNIVADASKSVDGDGCGIVLYDWDWNGDGVYDETTFTPTVPHEYATGFGGKIRVKITTVAGKTATASYIILVPEFIDVTQYVDLETLASHLDRTSGAIVCDVVLGNKTDTVKTLRDKFYFALRSTTNLFLASPDGTLDDGTPYVDITELVEAALPTVGDADVELDPGETVRLEDAIRIYSRDRSMPIGFIFAVWADPPPSMSAIHVDRAPRLSVRPAPAGQLSIIWPASTVQYVVEETENLARANWRTLSASPVLQGQQNAITVPVGSDMKFYRLKQK